MPDDNDASNEHDTSLPGRGTSLEQTASLVMAFDFGLKQIGVAIGQQMLASARPLLVLSAKEGQPQWPEVESLIREWRPDYLVVGLPLNMDGSESEMAVRARKFANRLHGRLGLPVSLCDERLSSFDARNQIASGRYASNDALKQTYAGQANRAKQDKAIDAVAAQLILQSWFERGEKSQR